MTRTLESKSIGRAPSCDLVIDHPSVSDVHARLALQADGGLLLLDQGSESGLGIDRGCGWRRAVKVRLCAGDRIRIGDAEAPLARLAGLFSPGAEAGPPRGRKAFESMVPGVEVPLPLNLGAARRGRLRRNPFTGQIEHEEPETP